MVRNIGAAVKPNYLSGMQRLVRRAAAPAHLHFWPNGQDRYGSTGYRRADPCAESTRAWRAALCHASGGGCVEVPLLPWFASIARSCRSISFCRSASGSTTATPTYTSTWARSRYSGKASFRAATAARQSSLVIAFLIVWSAFSL
jgi:hypothetical protein